VNDSKNELFDNDKEWNWRKSRGKTSENEDLYFFGYGHDYKEL